MFIVKVNFKKASPRYLIRLGDVRGEAMFSWSSDIGEATKFDECYVGRGRWVDDLGHGDRDRMVAYLDSQFGIREYATLSWESVP